jgi:hypothetical protein
LLCQDAKTDPDTAVQPTFYCPQVEHTVKIGGRMPAHQLRCLLSDVQFTDDRPVPFYIDPGQVIQHAAPLTDHHQQAAP